MKFIHTADIHLGSRMDSRFSKEISDKRKEELRNTFKRMVDFGNRNKVTAIILAGDVFDSNFPFKKDKEFFYSVIRNNPEIDFLYLKGNHDLATDYDGDAIPNLKTFNDNWTSFCYGDTVITGTEITSENYISMYSALRLDKDKKNIVVLHGQCGDIFGVDKVNLKKLRDKNIDYLALGHLHSHTEGKLDDRAVYAYSGCLEGRGFDEPGEHGFILLETGDKITRNFIPFAERTISEHDIDITDIKDAYSAYRKIKESITFLQKNIYRINLTGEIDLDVDDMSGDIEKYLSSDCLYADVKDRTIKKLDMLKYKSDPSLKGEFVRCVFANGEYTEEEKKKIIAYGLKALDGRNFDI